MSEQTPPQAEGERGPSTALDERPTSDAHQAPRTTPSQAEGEDAAEESVETTEKG
ncbi:hypothetical protein [Streptomyces zagrosensis]|uniref:Uncharacterized protein n=1 Tax=Streptomyces zagrosensis TaxID=1042984 RepID=A0A7W9QG11_9ACTN|nr:hypothetical protein [Streptomyces zagrosensis]MBB5939043.1 hypothetical protein [Streptomyces zagrosensis]